MSACNEYRHKTSNTNFSSLEDFSSHGILCFECCACSQCAIVTWLSVLCRTKSFRNERVRDREEESDVNEREKMLFVAFMCKLYGDVIIKKMSSSRKSIFLSFPDFNAQNVST